MNSSIWWVSIIDGQIVSYDDNDDGYLIFYLLRNVWNAWLTTSSAFRCCMKLSCGSMKIGAIVSMNRYGFWSYWSRIVWSVRWWSDGSVSNRSVWYAKSKCESCYLRTVMRECISSMKLIDQTTWSNKSAMMSMNNASMSCLSKFSKYSVMTMTNASSIAMMKWARSENRKMNCWWSCAVYYKKMDRKAGKIYGKQSFKYANRYYPSRSWRDYGMIWFI